MVREIVLLASGLGVMKPFCNDTLAVQVKLVRLSYILGVEMLRVLVNSGCEPDSGAIFTLESLFDIALVPLSQATSISATEMEISVEGLSDMLQMREKGIALPANSVPEGIEMSTVGA